MRKRVNTIKENLLLHPVRMRIILAMVAHEATAQQLAGELPDIPQATLYRNINKLVAGGILVVVRERRVHNTLEKTYALPERGRMLTVEDLQNAQPEDYVRLVTQYLGLLLSYFVRYVQKGDVDIVRDNVLFQMAPAYMNQAEAQELGEGIRALLAPYVKNPPTPDRQRSILGLITLPDVAGALNPGGSSEGTEGTK